MATAITKQKEVPEMDDVAEENLDDRAGNGKATGIKKDRSILAGS